MTKLDHALGCRMCGLFGYKLRRRNRNADARAHIWWAQSLRKEPLWRQQVQQQLVVE